VVSLVLTCVILFNYDIRALYMRHRIRAAQTPEEIRDAFGLMSALERRGGELAYDVYWHDCEGREVCRELARRNWGDVDICYVSVRWRNGLAVRKQMPAPNWVPWRVSIPAW